MDQPTINSPGESNPPAAPVGATPFKMPENIAPPEPMGGPAPSGSTPPAPTASNTAAPSPAAPAAPAAPSAVPQPPKPMFSYFLIAVLILILFGGIILFAGYRGWIKLGGLFPGKPSPTPTAVIASPTISPAVSSVLPSGSPRPSLSPSISPTASVNLNDQTRKNDLAEIKAALKKYYETRSIYPPATTAIKTSDQTSALTQALVPTFLEKLPDDPLAPQYYYGYKSDGVTFELTAVLEDKTDSSGKITGSYNIYKVTDSSVE